MLSTNQLKEASQWDIILTMSRLAKELENSPLNQEQFTVILDIESKIDALKDLLTNYNRIIE
jgi:hypothetical protein